MATGQLRMPRRAGFVDTVFAVCKMSSDTGFRSGHFSRPLDAAPTGESLSSERTSPQEPLHGSQYKKCDATVSHRSSEGRC